MKRALLLGTLLFCVSSPGPAHDVITTKLTWNREISRIVAARCLSCHHDGGRAFSLKTYAEARPWAVAIKEAVLARQMPPWGAIKGFGEFRNDMGLTGEQIEWITAWVVGGAPEGDPADLDPEPKIGEPSPPVSTKGGVIASGDLRLSKELLLDGLMPESVPDGASIQIFATLPGGGSEPLLWLYEYKTAFPHPFLLRTPLKLPRGTLISGVPKTAKIVLLPASH